MCASKTMALICDSDMCLRVRPRLGRWHYTTGVIIRVSYPILNGSSGKGKSCINV
ncbi:hypothetical protein F383_36130 [Gossypium arboreum]|uniref:Uncharacterized protein n=1 Tax=Gossypium arboreum TaxID=29729 RepID=A0A0B0N7J6_GOSAR|nr:hypothetical protein F383_36130 [Gossypium arboreum]